MEEVYTQVCTLFGENPKVVEPSDFFKTFIDFMANYKVAVTVLLLKLARSNLGNSLTAILLLKNCHFNERCFLAPDLVQTSKTFFAE